MLTILFIYDKITNMKKEFLECGRVCSPHGVRGVLKVESWCDTPKVLASRKRVFLADGSGAYKEMTVLGGSVSDERFVLLTLSGIDSREAAQGYKNAVLYLKREDVPVPRGSILIADMIGLPVIDIDTGRVYGRLSDVSDGVRSKLYTVKTEAGDVLLPAVPEFIKEIDGDRGVFIKPIPGFFEEV